jgi:NAD-dependent deacetylase
MTEKKITQLHQLVNNATKIVAFTGAGFSAESGISTFRGAGGVWSKYNPDIYANIHVFMQDPTYYWKFFLDERYPVMKKANPNKGHYALVKLEKRGKLYRVITQNIDGLHQIAGNTDVIELHGTTRTINCLNCKKTYSMDQIYTLLHKELPPRCSCGGMLKTGTVLFGESLPQHALDQASLAVKHCDLFIVLGSSLVVYPAASLPQIAKEHGATLVIINIDPTPLDDLADIVINASTSRILTTIIK